MLKLLEMHCYEGVVRFLIQIKDHDWINTLKDHGISISMDGRGSYLDNIFIERLWRSVKQEKIYRYDFETIEEVEQALTEYFDYRTYAKLRSLRWI